MLATIVLILLLSSCATARYTITDSTDSVAVSDADRVHLERVVQTLQVLDSVFVHDSVWVKEGVDTVWMKEFHTRYKYRDRIVHDTLCKTDTVVQTKTQTITKTRTIREPPERYIPRFYKVCTGILIALVVAALLYLAYRITKAVYLRR